MQCRTLDTSAILVEGPLPGSSELIRSALGTLYWVRFTGLGRWSTAELASELIRLPTTSPNTRHELSFNSETVIAPAAWFALPRGWPAVRRYAYTFLPNAACREASNAGARRLLGRLPIRTLGTRYTPDANATALDATPLTQNATHKLYARNTVSSGGASDQTMRNTRTAIEGVRWQRETREQGNAWSHNSTGVRSVQLAQSTPPQPHRCSICVPATGPISLRNLLLAGRIKGEKEAPGNFHNLTDTQKTHVENVRITQLRTQGNGG